MGSAHHSFHSRTPDYVRLRRPGFDSLKNYEKRPTHRKGELVFYGGDGGSRTHVRKSIPETFYERSLSFKFPLEKRR